MSNDGTEEAAARGNEWEVVSLTASEYAAPPGPGSKQEDADDELKVSEEYEAETSSALFMSRHFAFPPSWHENLLPDPEKSEILTEQVVKDTKLVSEEGGMTYVKNEEHVKSKGLRSPEFHGIQDIYEKDNQLSANAAEYEDKEQMLYSTATYSSLHGEEHMFGSIVSDDSSASNDLLESLEQVCDDSKHGGDGVPCQAWWKRQAASLIAHAKEASTFWSVFIAAAVMGLVIIGQCWQHERRQLLQLKWQDERMVGPLSRLKDAIIGGERRGASIRGSTPAQR